MDSYRWIDFGLDGEMDRFGWTFANRPTRSFDAGLIHLDRLFLDSPIRYGPTFESTHGNSFLRPRTHCRPITFLWIHIGARVPRSNTGTRVSHLSSLPRGSCSSILDGFGTRASLPFFGFIFGSSWGPCSPSVRFLRFGTRVSHVAFSYSFPGLMIPILRFRLLLL
jgi:hypothetical protein